MRDICLSCDKTLDVSTLLNSRICYMDIYIYTYVHVPQQPHIFRTSPYARSSNFDTGAWKFARAWYKKKSATCKCGTDDKKLLIVALFHALCASARRAIMREHLHFIWTPSNQAQRTDWVRAVGPGPSPSGSICTFHGRPRVCHINIVCARRGRRGAQRERRTGAAPVNAAPQNPGVCCMFWARKARAFSRYGFVIDKLPPHGRTTTTTSTIEPGCSRESGGLVPKPPTRLRRKRITFHFCPSTYTDQMKCEKEGTTYRVYNTRSVHAASSSYTPLHVIRRAVCGVASCIMLSAECHRCVCLQRCRQANREREMFHHAVRERAQCSMFLCP